MTKQTEITEKDIQKALKRPNDFGYFGSNPDMFKTWSLGPVILTRDSRLVDESNASAIKKTLEAIPEIKEDWDILSANHWACGWVEHLTFRVLDPDGSPSRVFREIKALFDAIESYPILDESDYSDREYQATVENIENNGRSFIKENPPEGWASQVFSWFWDNDQSAVESTDDQGGYPSDKQLKEALGALGLLDSND